nr:PREDICTED: uncharacterized protein LOC107078201 isoform X3 [Lepisosteus oculatus]
MNVSYWCSEDVNNGALVNDQTPAVPVPTSPQSDNRQLTRAVGQSVTFQIPVLQRGYLKYGESTTIAAVLNSEFSVFGKFKGTERFTWDRATGFFTITALSSEDAGVYTVERKEEEHTMTVEFSLTVYRADDSVLLYAGAAGGGAVCLGIVALVLYCRLRGKKPRDEDSSPTNNGALGSGPAEVTYAALDMKRLKKPTSVPPAGEDHTVYAEVTGGGRMQGSHFAPEPPPAAGTLASECTEYARVNFRRKTRRAQDAVLYY